MHIKSIAHQNYFWILPISLFPLYSFPLIFIQVYFYKFCISFACSSVFFLYLFLVRMHPSKDISTLLCPHCSCFFFRSQIFQNKLEFSSKFLESSFENRIWKTYTQWRTPNIISCRIAKSVTSQLFLLFRSNFFSLTIEILHKLYFYLMKLYLFHLFPLFPYLILIINFLFQIPDDESLICVMDYRALMDSSESF